MKFPEGLRVKGNRNESGVFVLKISFRTRLNIIASNELGWDHVSICSISDGVPRTPTWSEMCKAKDLFWEKTETVVQFHPQEVAYVNIHPHVLHLWKKQGEEYELPPSILV